MIGFFNYRYRLGTGKNYQAPPDGYHSIKGVGKRIPDPNEEKRIDGTIVPCGKTIDNTTQGIAYSGLTYNEYCVYDPRRVLIKYIVEFENV